MENVMKQEERTCIITDIECPGDERIVDKENKTKNYDNLKRELFNEVLGSDCCYRCTITEELPKSLEKLWVRIKIGHLKEIATIWDCSYIP